MSLTPYLYVEKFNPEEKKWEKISLYNSKKKEIDFWPWNATYEVFNLIKQYGKTDIDPGTFSEEVKEEYEKYGYYDLFSSVNEEEKKYVPCYVLPLFVLDQIYLKNPKVVDVDAKCDAWEAAGDIEYEKLKDEDFLTDNPIKTLIDRVMTWVELDNDFLWWGSEDRIIHGDEIRVIAWIM